MRIVEHVERDTADSVFLSACVSPIYHRLLSLSTSTQPNNIGCALLHMLIQPFSQVAVDDEFALMSVTLFRKVRDDFIHKARENK